MVTEAGRSDAVTFSLIKLQRLRAGFDDLHDGRPRTVTMERTLVRLARQLGATAIPTCLRELCSPIDDRSRWAYALLGSIGEIVSHRERVIADLGRLCATTIADMAKLRAMSLLNELGAPELPSAELSDPDAARARSLHDLAACLINPAEIARAADLLVDQLEPGELCEFIEDLSASEDARTAALATELLLRDDLDEKTRAEIRRLSSPVLYRAGRPRPQRPRTASAHVGFHADGRRIVVTQARRAASRPLRWRLWCALISPEGVLMDCHYVDELTPSEIEREVTSPLVEEGFALEPADPTAARDIVAQAARAARVMKPRLPRSYFVGRDMLGLTDEHLGSARSRQRGGDLAALLARATDLLSAGDTSAARPLVERYVAAVPDDPEGLAALGACALALGEPDLARGCLERAVWLDPEEPRYLWNLAAAAHRCGHRGACYIALTRYLAVAVAEEAEQLRVAQSFITEYDRLARLHHPGQDPLAVARADMPPAGRGSRKPRRMRSRRRRG